MIWNTVKIAVDKYFELVLWGAAKQIEVFEKVARLVGADGLAGSLAEAREAVVGLGSEFANSADVATESLDEEIRKQKELEDQNKEIQDAASKFTGDALAATLKRIAKGWSDVKDTSKAAAISVQEVSNMFEAAFSGQQRFFERQNQIAANEAAFQQQLDDYDKAQQDRDDAEKERIENRKQMAEEMVDIAMTMGDGFGDAFASVAMGAASVEEAMKKFAATLIDTIIAAVEKVIIAEAAQAAAMAGCGERSEGFRRGGDILSEVEGKDPAQFYVEFQWGEMTSP